MEKPSDMDTHSLFTRKLHAGHTNMQDVLP